MTQLESHSAATAAGSSGSSAATGGGGAAEGAAACVVCLEQPENDCGVLPCGHVLALGSVTKLARGARTGGFKCPYCTCQCTIAAATALSV